MRRFMTVLSLAVLAATAACSTASISIADDSPIAGPELTAIGYTDVVELGGGMQAWQAADRPLLPAGS